ncbi:RNA binding family protein, partial [Trifolium medium]|nr:RNA binding family protein [Trifolium medium]
QEDKFVAGRVATLLWNLWQNRNDELWNNTKLSPTQIGHKAHQMWQRWIEANQMRSRSQQDSRMHGITTWTKPREGWIKCNEDAGFFHGRCITTVACCARNSNGELQVHRSRQYHLKLTTLEGEGLALYDAVHLAIQQGDGTL